MSGLSGLDRDSASYVISDTSGLRQKPRPKASQKVFETVTDAISSSCRAVGTAAVPTVLEPPLHDRHAFVSEVPTWAPSGSKPNSAAVARAVFRVEVELPLVCPLFLS